MEYEKQLWHSTRISTWTPCILHLHKWHMQFFRSIKIQPIRILAYGINMLYSHASLETLSNIINYELSHLSTWFKTNNLSLNINKTKCTLCSNKRSKYITENINSKLHDKIITPVSTTKFLGLQIDENYDWLNQISIITVNISKYAGVLRRLRAEMHLIIHAYHTATLHQDYVLFFAYRNERFE